jgi:hypothetical protein
MDQDYINFVKNLKLPPSTQAAINAFQFADVLAAIMEDGIEEGDLTYYKCNSDIVIQLCSDVFCIRQPWLKDFAKELRMANRLRLEKQDDMFILKAFFSAETN